jgi:hypothetical protein
MRDILLNNASLYQNFIFILFFKGGTKCHKSTHSTHPRLTLCTQNFTNAIQENEHL